MRTLHLPLALFSLSALVASSPMPKAQQQDLLILELSNRLAPAPSSGPSTQQRPDVNSDDELLQAVSDRLLSDSSFLSRTQSHLPEPATPLHTDVSSSSPLGAMHTCSDISALTFQIGGTDGAKWVFQPQTTWLVAVLSLAAFVMSVMILGEMLAAGVRV
jgi:hypothetical protein